MYFLLARLFEILSSCDSYLIESLLLSVNVICKQYLLTIIYPLLFD